jgi:site-specific recombinase XerC
MSEHSYRRTQRTIEADIRHFFDHAKLSDNDPITSLAKPLVVAWKVYEMKKTGLTTVNKKLRHLSHFCSWCEAHDHLPTNPTRGLRVGARAERAGKMIRKAFSPEQLRLIVNALQVRRETARTKYLEQFYWVCVVVLFTGMRSRKHGTSVQPCGRG